MRGATGWQGSRGTMLVVALVAAAGSFASPARGDEPLGMAAVDVDALLAPYRVGDDLNEGCSLDGVYASPHAINILVGCSDGTADELRIVRADSCRIGQRTARFVIQRAEAWNTPAGHGAHKIALAIARNDDGPPRAFLPSGDPAARLPLADAAGSTDMGTRFPALALLAIPWNAAEAGLWLLVLLMLPPFFFELVGEARAQRQARTLAVLLALGLAARLLVPLAPINWYFAAQNGLGEADRFFHRTNALLPLPFRWLLFDSGLGTRAIVPWNLLLGLAAVPSYWLAAVRATGSRRTAIYFAGFYALMPLFVRLAAMDAPVVTGIFLASLVSATFVKIARGGELWSDAALLFAATALLVPTRPEWLPGIVCIPLLLFRGRLVQRDLLPSRRAAIAFALGLALGACKLLPQHLGTAGNYFEVHALNAVAFFVGRLAFLHPVIGTIVGTGSLPAVLSVPVWLLIARRVRARDGRGLFVLWLPTLMVGWPFMAGPDGPVRELVIEQNSGGFHALDLTFMLLVMARGCAELHDGIRDGTVMPRRDRRVVLALLLVAAVPLAWLSLWRPLAWRFAFQQEYRFLERTLPERPATVLTIWDPDTGTNDVDCCLALPHPSVWLDHPRLRWINLRRRDLEAGRLAGIDFDYFYPGAMQQLDLARLDGARARASLGNSSARIEMLRRHVEQVRALDAAVRAAYPLEVTAADEQPGLSFGSLPFPADRVRLEMLRRKR